MDILVASHRPAFEQEGLCRTMEAWLILLYKFYKGPKMLERNQFEPLLTDPSVLRANKRRESERGYWMNSVSACGISSVGLFRQQRAS